MKTIDSEKRLCFGCMEVHNVQTVICHDTEIFKDEEVSFDAIYEYCNRKDTLLEVGDMMNRNSLAMKDAYRRKMNLLPSDAIIKIREKYDISQKDFSTVLDWGQATITRYENHQVQDSAHNDILLKIDQDPDWFLKMLERSKDKLPAKAYKKYWLRANEEYVKKENQYLAAAICARYAKYRDTGATGGVKLNLDKVVEMINYLAQKVDSLHKVKLMKMLWYADILHYRRERRAISGLVYLKMDMGAVPDAHNLIVSLAGVEYCEKEYGENVGYRFKTSKKFKSKLLSESEISALDTVISKFGEMNSNEIISAMHCEEAYKRTEKNAIISYVYADKLSVK